MSRRNSVVIALEEAAAAIPDGAVIGIGGFVTTNKPMALLRQLMRERRKGLTVVAAPSGLEVDMMIALGMVDKLITPYVGAEAISPVGPFHSKWAGRTFRVEEVDLGTLVTCLRARFQGVPFLPVMGAVGTSLPELNPNLKWLDDPFGGPPVVVAAPVKIDVAIIHASQADRYGNVQHRGAVFVDNLIAQAANKVIVQVEKLVSNEEIRSAPTETTLPCEFVDAVVLAPYGAHPSASQNYYQLDEGLMKEYLRAGRSFLQGDAAPLEGFWQKYVDGPATHCDYLAAVGLDRLFGLGLEV